MLNGSVTQFLNSVLAHGEVGNWDEIILYGGIALVFIFIVVFAIFKSQKSEPDLEDKEQPKK